MKPWKQYWISRENTRNEKPLFSCLFILLVSRPTWVRCAYWLSVACRCQQSLWGAMLIDLWVWITSLFVHRQQPLPGRQQAQVKGVAAVLSTTQSAKLLLLMTTCFDFDAHAHSIHRYLYIARENIVSDTTSATINLHTIYKPQISCSVHEHKILISGA